jgi:hypothetical protein
MAQNMMLAGLKFKDVKKTPMKKPIIDIFTELNNIPELTEEKKATAEKESKAKERREKAMEKKAKEKAGPKTEVTDDVK